MTKTTSEVLVRARKLFGQSQENMAHILGMSVEGYLELETPGRNDIDVKVVKDLIDFVGNEVSHLATSLALRREAGQGISATITDGTELSDESDPTSNLMRKVGDFFIMYSIFDQNSRLQILTAPDKEAEEASKNLTEMFKLITPEDIIGSGK